MMYYAMVNETEGTTTDEELRQNGIAMGDSLEELEVIDEVYSSEESRLIDAMADAYLALLELGDRAPARNMEAREFARMLDDLTEAKSAVEYDDMLGCYGDLGRNHAVREFVAFKQAQLAV